MADKEKELKQNEASKECEVDALDKVSGGKNPFADIKRVKVHEIDEDLREKI